jgi:hypothetical protein
MYGFLFDQTYINLIIMGFFLFLIMFLWRKITIIEGNYFILEKRVDMIKKTDRDSLISKNMEKADVVMNEIFKDSTGGAGVAGGSGGGGKKNYCNNVSYCPPEAILKSQKPISKDSQSSQSSQSSKDSEDIDMSSYMIDAVAAVAAVATVSSKPEIVIDEVEVSDDASVVIESKNKIEIIECKEGDDVVINKNVEYSDCDKDDDNASDVPSVVKMDMTADNDSENDIRDILYACSAQGATGSASGNGADTGDNNIDNDAMSVSSDITFGTDQDKSITKKYKKMSIEKLREECVEKSLNSEGTKAILIGRILEYNKKA